MKRASSILVLSVLLAGAVLWALEGAASSATSNAIQLVAAGVATWACLQRARREPPWRGVAVAAGLWTSGQAAATVHDLTGAVTDLVAVVLFGAAGVAAIVAVERLVAAGDAGRLGVALDALAATVAVVGMLWEPIFRPAIDAVGLLPAVFPVIDVAVAASCVSYACSARLAPRRMLVLAGGLVALAAADTVFLHQLGRGGFVSGAPSDALWVLAFAAIGLAATARPDVTVGHGGWRLVVPMVPLGLLLPRATQLQLTTGEIPPALVYAGAAAGAAFIARQLQLRRQTQALATRLALVVDYAVDGLVAVAADGTCIFVNDAGAGLLGVDAADVVGRRMHDVVHPCRPDGSAYPVEACPLAAAVAAGQQRCDPVEWFARADGSFLPVAVAAHPIDGSTAGDIRSVVTFRDVSSELAAAEELRRSEARWRALVQNANDVILVLDHAGAITDSTASAERVFGYALGENRGRPFTEFVHPDDLPLLTSTFETLLAANGRTVQLECRVRCDDGRWLHAELVAANLLDEPAVGGVVCNVRDVSERHRTQARLAHQASHDALTGLDNRVALHAAIARRLDAEGRAGLLLMDVDGFKDINDALGHQAGDQLLVALADRLRTATRRADVVARLGGDEFAVLLDDLPTPEALRGAAERIAAALEDPLDLGDWRLPIGLSIGAAAVGAEEGEADLLLQHADIAMYRAKHGGFTVAVYGDADEEDRLLRLQVVADLPGALEAGDIVVHYQPKVALEDGTIAGVEALARWHHPRLGPISPELFVSVAEHTGLAVRLLLHVLSSALEQAARWQQEGLEVPVAVNLSPALLADPNLPAHVFAALHGAGIRPELLTIEITEAGVVDVEPVVLAAMAELRSAGVRLSIDDFGTGYSSLAYLTQLPVDELKVDRTFVTDIGDNDVNRRIVSTIVDLAHALGLRVVAEGVEDERGAEVLRALGCEQAQGFGLHRPAPGDELGRAALVGEDVAVVR